MANAIELQAGTKLKCVASPTASTTQVGTVIELDGDYIVHSGGLKKGGRIHGSQRNEQCG